MAAQRHRSEAKPHNFRFCTMPNVIPSKNDCLANDYLLVIFEAVMTKMEAPFEQLLDRLVPPPTLIIYDILIFWVVAVGNRKNIPVASFWPMTASFFLVFQHYHLLEQHGHYPVNALEVGDKRVDYFPGISSARLVDFPWTDGSSYCRRMLQWISKGFSCVPKAQYLVLATTYEFEPQAIDVLKSDFSLPIYPIGPAIPYLNVKLSSSSSISNDQTDLTSYFQWLDNQPSSSVLYIAQGSFLSVSNAQIEEIAFGLRSSGVRFLWVAREETRKLREICGDNGLVLEWCAQLRVLMHDAVGGFWSHCGWNSTTEAVFAGVPFLTFPITFDQMLNSKMIVEDWKVGWRVKKDVDPQSLVRRDEIAELLQKFMNLDDEERRDMRKRVNELQRICQLAIASGGSSETNINAFIGDMTKRS